MAFTKETCKKAQAQQMNLSLNQVLMKVCYSQFSEQALGAVGNFKSGKLKIIKEQTWHIRMNTRD